MQEGQSKHLFSYQINWRS